MGKDFFLKQRALSVTVQGSGRKKKKKPVDIVFFFGDSSFESDPRTQIPEEMTKIIIFKTHIVHCDFSLEIFSTQF